MSLADVQPTPFVSNELSAARMLMCAESLPFPCVEMFRYLDVPMVVVVTPTFVRVEHASITNSAMQCRPWDHTMTRDRLCM